MKIKIKSTSEATVMAVKRDSHSRFKKLAIDLNLPMIKLYDKISHLSPKVLKEILK